MSKVVLTTALAREECVRRLRSALKEKSCPVLGRVGARSFTLTGRFPWQWQRAVLGFRLHGRFVSSSSGESRIECDTGWVGGEVVTALVAAVFISTVLPRLAGQSLGSDSLSNEVESALVVFLLFCAMIFVRRLLVGRTLLRGEGAFLLRFVKSALDAADR